MELAEIVMNPVRQRIFQYFLLHETGTVKEVRKALPDVPSASLYRHIKILADSSILMVVGENRIRGTVESVYQLNQDAMSTEDETGNAVQMSLLSICAFFAKYFSTGNANPRKDMLLFTNCTLLLTDEEFSEYLSEINQVTVKYMKQETSETSKPRQITCQGRNVIDSKRRAEFDPIADIAKAGIITAGYGSAGISAGGAV